MLRRPFTSRCGDAPMEPAPADALLLVEPHANEPPTALLMKWQRATEEACEYARNNHLTHRHELICPQRCLRQAAEHQLCQRDAGLTSDANLPSFVMKCSVNVYESLSLTRGALETLATVYQSSTKVELDKCIEDISRNATRKIKLELPLLSSDHEADCREFRREIEAISAPQIKNHMLPRDPADSENDEGLEFPSNSLRIVRRMVKAREPEAITVSKALMEYLLRQLKVDQWTPEDQDRLIRDQLVYTSSRTREPLTPPLSPMFLPKVIYIPDNDARQIPSDCSSRCSEELKTTEDALFRLEQIGDPDASIDIASPSDLFPDLPPTSPDDFSTLKGHNLDNIKVEVPLMSGLNDGNSSRFPFDLQFTAESIDHSSPSTLDLTGELFYPELKAGLKKVATETMRKMEQEKLQVADAVARVAVPVMDFSAPAPPWEGAQQSASGMFLDLKKNDPKSFKLPEWPEGSLVEGQMQWAPVPWKAAISTHETVDCSDELLSSFLGPPNEAEVLASVQPDRECTKLLVLRDADADDDDELEPMFVKGKTGPTSDFMDPIKKRNMTQEQRKGIQVSHVIEDGGNMASLKAQSASLIGTPSNLLIADGPGATSSLLNNYMELRAPHKVLHRSRFFDLPAKPTVEPSRCETLEVCKGAQDVPVNLPTAPFPAFDSSATPAKVVIAVGLSRGITSRLEALLPKLSFVERDYSAYNSSVWHPGSIRRSELISPLAYDADIILSPASGIVITTMVKVRQRPIPGSQGTTVFRHRIDRISERYEHLIVLVSEGTNDGSETMGEMSPSDVLAFAELQGFLSGLDSTITAYYVGGGELTVARWAASFICRAEDGRDLEHFLIDSETYWELFLRRAGVNVYAAQAIAGSLRASNEVLEEAGRSGLAAFVRMTPQERVARFETVFGGRRVLQRVNRVMGQAWS